MHPRTVRIKRGSLAIAGLALVLCLAWVVHVAADGGVRITVKEGQSDSLQADGVSRTTLVVEIDPDAACWGGPLESEGTFTLTASSDRGTTLSPNVKVGIKFPAELVLTAGRETGTAAIAVQVSYCPPGAVGAFGVCTDRQRISSKCEAQITIPIAEASAPPDDKPPDRDGDKIPDDDDKCPDQKGTKEHDGCPEFKGALGCNPPTPVAGKAVACSVKVEGVRPGETLRYQWYVDSKEMAETSIPSWTWGKAEAGTHDIGVDVVGEEGRSFGRTVTLEVKQGTAGDDDGDGVPDDKDNCRNQYGEGADGCPKSQPPPVQAEQPAPPKPPSTGGGGESAQDAAKKEEEAPETVSGADRRSDLEKAVMGQDAVAPKPGKAAAAGVSIATLIASKLLLDLLTGKVKLPEGESSTGAPAKVTAPSSAPDRLPEASSRDASSSATSDRPPPALSKGPGAESPARVPDLKEGLAAATLRAMTEALERRLGRPPTQDEVLAEIRSGRRPAQRDIMAHLKRWAAETEAARTDLPKGWASRLADRADAFLEKVLPSTIQVYNPLTGKVSRLPNPNLSVQLARLLLSGPVDTLRFGEGFHEALRILEPKKRTLSQAAWDWSRASWHIVTDVLRGAGLADMVKGGVKAVSKGITSLVKPKPELPVIQGPLSSGAAEGAGRIGASPRIDLLGKRVEPKPRRPRMNLLRGSNLARMERQVASDACIADVECKIVNDLLGRNYTPQRVYFQSSDIARLGYRRAGTPGASGGGFAIPKALEPSRQGTLPRPQTSGLDYGGILNRWRAWDGLSAKPVHPHDISVQTLRDHLKSGGSAIQAIVKRGDSGHAIRVLRVEGTRPALSTTVHVWDPAGGGSVRQLPWPDFMNQLRQAILIRKT